MRGVAAGCVTWCPTAIDITEVPPRSAPRPAAHQTTWAVRDMQTVDQILAAQPFFHGLEDEAIALIAGCARNGVGLLLRR